MSEDIRRDPTTTRPEQEREVREERDVVHEERDVVHEDGAAQPHGDVPVDTTSQRAPADEPAQDTTRAGHVDRDPSSERIEPEGASGPGASTPWSAHAGLLPDDELVIYQERWDELQVRFIDEPRHSVRQADDLVGEVTRQIVERFTHGRDDFEQRWESGDEPTTEELRQALQRYRDYFRRLVTQ